MLEKERIPFDPSYFTVKEKARRGIKAALRA
jgi:hypothetical protein